MILGLAILTGFQLLGEVIRAAFSLPLPGPVIGMFLLAIVLATAPAESFPGKQLRKSLEDVSRMLIEHMGLLTIGKPDKTTGMHVLLDGHIRLFAMKQIGFKDAPCLVATDDETYTYNNRINRLSTIQEHFMIRRAVERGVTPARLAQALSVDISHIIKKMNLLDGVCAEAAELLKDQQFSANVGAVIRKLKPTRQVECVELMVATNNITVSYAQALLAATPSHLLVDEVKPKKIGGLTPEQMAKMEREMGNIQGQFKLVEQTYGGRAGIRVKMILKPETT